MDFYFRVKEKKEPEKTAVIPVTTTMEPLKDELPLKEKRQQEISQDAINTFKVLLKMVQKRGLKIKTLDLPCANSHLKGDRVGIRKGLPLETVNYEIAFELFHFAVNYNRGDMINTPLSCYYREQAERAASLIIELLNVENA